MLTLVQKKPRWISLIMASSPGRWPRNKSVSCWARRNLKQMKGKKRIYCWVGDPVRYDPSAGMMVRLTSCCYTSVRDPLFIFSKPKLTAQHQCELLDSSSGSSSKSERVQVPRYSVVVVIISHHWPRLHYKMGCGMQVYQDLISSLNENLAINASISHLHLLWYSLGQTL